jgi:hypothetical protein
MVMEEKMGGQISKINLSGRYDPVAIYYEDADMVEYIRQDVPCVNRRIDEFLTLTLDMRSREPISFKLKGFKNFYLRCLKNEAAGHDRDQFLALVGVLEKAIQVLGDNVFGKERQDAYDQARRIAKEDGATLHELPDTA